MSAQPIEYTAWGCKPAASILNVKSKDVNCNKCPFPFCVIAEAQIIKIELREHLMRIMNRLHSTAEETAKVLDVSMRSVYRYKNTRDTGCTWCNLTHSQDVLCKSNVYSVVRMGMPYFIILNKHKCVTEPEFKQVEYFAEYVFPSGIIRKLNGGHDYWVVNRVEPEESKRFEGMCDALNRYTMSLSGVRSRV